MASLPEDRVKPGKPPFSTCGVDCFGPFIVRRGRASVKRYGCLFTCLVTRAVHIEKLESLDTDSFINAMRRFEARRGRPELVQSDNGTNFTGAERELRQAIASWNSSKLNTYMLKKEINWIFNPPSASHMGGVWERQIRTVRKVLSSLLVHDQGLRDEDLSTILCEVESIVNSRPITYISDSVKDAEPLSPNHLLLLRSNQPYPPGDFTVHDVYTRRWRHVQHIVDVFWKRWIKEYLPTIQLRKKWHQGKPNVCVGDIVLIMDERTPRKVWPLGRVIQIFPGRDGLMVNGSQDGLVCAHPSRPQALFAAI